MCTSTVIGANKCKGAMKMTTPQAPLAGNYIKPQTWTQSDKLCSVVEFVKVAWQPQIGSTLPRDYRITSAASTLHSCQ
eukprot:346400-Amphidinium_carterae.1